jgi:uncharacterized repeat protein (TIGR01451 family)
MEVAPMKVILALVAGVALTAGFGGKTPAKADVSLTVVGAPDPLGIGKTAVYTITVRNSGPARATGVLVRATFPTGLEVASQSGSACSDSRTAITCRLGTLRKGARVTIKVAAKAVELGTLTVSVRASAKTADPRRRNNAGTVTTRVAGNDTVNGHGVRPLFGNTFVSVSVDVDAVSAFNGEDAAGTFSTRYGQGYLELRGQVVCLVVAGNRAMVGGIVETSNSSQNPPGSGVLLGFTDNGQPGAGRDTQVSYLTVENPRSCALEDQTREHVLTAGDFVVHDEQP